MGPDLQKLKKKKKTSNQPFFDGEKSLDICGVGVSDLRPHIPVKK